jgi:cytidylate kinase
MQIAIDGYAGTGKGTSAKAVADFFWYLCLDTGAMYRAVTLFYRRLQILPADTEAIQAHIDDVSIQCVYHPAHGQTTYLWEEDVSQAIRHADVAQYVSWFAANPIIRAKLISLQQAIASSQDVVMDGRDIGTVVLPDADVKIFMTCDVEVRATRRYDEMISIYTRQWLDLSTVPSVESIATNMRERDWSDYDSPMSSSKRHPWAIVLDTTHRTPSQQISFIIDEVKKILV